MQEPVEDPQDDDHADGRPGDDPPLRDAARTRLGREHDLQASGRAPGRGRRAGLVPHHVPSVRGYVVPATG